MYDTPLKAKLPNVPEFEVDWGHPTNEWHRANFVTPNYEPFETQLFLELLSDAPRVLDIGANVGWYSLVASAASSGRARVLAFEPDPDNFALLGRNLALNFFHNVCPKQIALGDENRKGMLYLNSENLGDHRLSKIEGRASLEIAIARLDSVLDNIFLVPDLVKIDVQGAELQVFQGAESTFRRAGSSLAVCMEFYPEALGIETAHVLAEAIFSFKRPVFVIYPFEGNQLQPLGLERLHEGIEGCLHPRFNKHMDLIIAPDDARDARLERWRGREWQQWEY